MLPARLHKALPVNQSLLILDAFSLSPGEPACRALAGVLESANAARLPRFAQWLGLAEPEFWQMLDHCFPGARAAGWAPESAPVDAAALPCEFADLVQMLHRAIPLAPKCAGPPTRWPAAALAAPISGTTWACRAGMTFRACCRRISPRSTRPTPRT